MTSKWSKKDIILTLFWRHLYFLSSLVEIILKLAPFRRFAWPLMAVLAIWVTSNGDLRLKISGNPEIDSGARLVANNARSVHQMARSKSHTPSNDDRCVTTTHRCHGCSEEILSDSGTQLMDALWALGIRHHFTPVYTPQCNPEERTNRTIKTMITQFVQKKQRTWDEQLNSLQFAFNTIRHDATDYTPAYLNHSRELRRPEDPPNQGHAPPPNELRRRLEEAHELVRINLARAYQRQEKYYNLRHRDWRPTIGDIVWKREHPLSNREAAFNAKLAPKYVGLLEIRRVISPVILDVRDTKGNWYRHVHVKDFKILTDNQSEGDKHNKTDDDDSTMNE